VQLDIQKQQQFCIFICVLRRIFGSTLLLRDTNRKYANFIKVERSEYLQFVYFDICQNFTSVYYQK
jgi:hypothetical protein